MVRCVVLGGNLYMSGQSCVLGAAFSAALFFDARAFGAVPHVLGSAGVFIGGTACNTAVSARER